MKVFDRDDKINFVDDNNVFVGYDIEQDCCERADWFVSVKEKCSIPPVIIKLSLDDYNFDTSYFKKVESLDIFEEGGMVIFKLTSPDKPSLYLHLFNVQNGYYGHGFTATIGGIPWEQGII